MANLSISNSKVMKKVIKFVLIIVAIVVVIDLLVGQIGGYMVDSHKMAGDYKSVEYVMTQCDEDVLILGSSVALNGLVPAVITDSTGLSCYNGAANGQVLPFFETMLECVFQRYAPKTIIFGFRPNETTTTGIGERYNLLVPYYGKGYETLDRYLESSSVEEKYLLKSNLYRYNNIWWRILLYQFVTPNEQGEQGFVAKGMPRYYPRLNSENKDYESTPERLAQFSKIVEMSKAKGVNLVVVFLPKYLKLYNNGNLSSIRDIVDICKKNDVKYYIDVQKKEYLNDSTMFYDETHLNKEGAYKYTGDLVNRMKKDSIF